MLPDVRNSRLWELFQSIRLIFGVRKDTQPRRILCLKSPRNDQLKIAFTSTGLCTWSKESRTTDYNRRQNFSTSASGLVGKKGCGDHARRDEMERGGRAKGGSGGQMTGKKDPRRKRSGKIVRRKRQNETRGIAAKEISSVNGDNPYPGSNDDGMDVAKRERWERGERKERARGGGWKGRGRG